MAGSDFPKRKSQGAGGMTAQGAGQEQLDGPPPSPVLAQAQPLQPGGGAQSMPSFAQMAQPMTAGTPGRATSHEIAMGMMQTAETVNGIFDSMASIAPDLANDFALLKQQLQSTMAKLFQNSGTPGRAGATGMNFPGGGFAGGAQ